MNDKLNHLDLDLLLNTWPQGTIGNERDRHVIKQLDAMGRLDGYGFLAQLAQLLYEVQCNGQLGNARDRKRQRFESLGYELPPGFREKFLTPTPKEGE